MPRLVWKDILAAGWVLPAGLLLYVVQLAGMAASPPMVLLLTVMFTGLMAFGSIGVEEIQGTETLWCSLPVNRRDVVVARYTTTAIGIALGLGVSWAAGRLTLSTILAGSGHQAETFGEGAYAILFVLFFVCAALYLPCYFRLGAGRGLGLFAAISLSIVVVVSGAGWLVTQVLGGPETLERLREQSPEQLAAAREWVGRWGRVVMAGLVAGALALFAGSSVLAAHFYARRDC